MSRERDLLKQVIKNQYINDSDNKKLRAEIEGLLAQPEQEPVAWKDNTYGNLHHTNWGDSIPLYASPPTHKPLSDDDTVAMFKDNKLATHPDSYWAGIDDAEKAHGITVGGE